MTEFTPWFGEIRPVTGVILASGRNYPVNGERYFFYNFLATKEVYDQKDSSFCKLYTIMDDVRSIYASCQMKVLVLPIELCTVGYGHPHT
jgi:hypothetical protein